MSKRNTVYIAALGLTGLLAPPLHAADDTRFYGQQAFTIVYQQTGKVDAGQIVEHSRDWGRTRAEVVNTTTTIMGMNQKRDQRIVYEGAKITTIDNATGSVSTTTNPMYEKVVASIGDKSGVEVGKQMMASMGGKPTGQKETIAGHTCEVWEVAQFGARMCITGWGATLRLTSNIAGMGIEKVAREVRLGDPGPASVYQYDASKATQQPSLQEIMKRARGTP